MNVKVENIEKNVTKLEITVDAEKFEEGLQKSFAKNAGKFSIPGFRKGKAPRKMVERYYGEQVLYEDAINIVCSEAYDLAVEQNDIHPVDRPEIDIKQIGTGQELIFTASVTVKPEVELGQYKGVEVKKVEAKVSGEDVDNEINKALDKNARIITVDDRGIQEGDIAVIDFEGLIDGVPFEGGSAEGYSLTIGSGQFIPGFESQLIGALTGDQVDVNVTFPEEYGKAELAGQPALFKVKVHEIKAKELPVLDDEFAKDVSEFDTLEEYRKDLENKLIKDAEHKAKHETESAVLDKVVENAAVEIPAVMIEKQIDRIMRELDYRLQYQGLDLGKYLEMMGQPYETFRDQYKSRAEKEVKTQLVLEKITKNEQVEVSEDEIAEEIKTTAQNYNMSEEDFKKQLKDEDIEYIKDTLAVKKTIDVLVANAQIA